MGIISGIIIGIIAGWLSGKITKGHGFGLIRDLIIGVLGGIIGGYLFPLLGLKYEGYFGSIICSTAGAIVLLFLLKLIMGGK